MSLLRTLISGKSLGRLTLICLLGLLPLQAPVAQTTFDLDDLDEGQLLLNLSISETGEVEQDLLSAVLQFMVRGTDRTILQQKVNQAMTEAMESLRDKDDISYQTQHYHVQPLFRQNDNAESLEQPVWQAQQSLQLSGLDSVAVLTAAAQLQARGLTMQQLSYSLSPSRHRETSQSLLETAISKLQGRAEHTAQLMGKQDARIIELSLNDSSNPGMRYRSMAMASADSEAMTTPVAEAGLTTVSVSISARVLIGP